MKYCEDCKFFKLKEKKSKITDITLIVDRSGSMESCRVEAQGGINSFIEDQKKAKGENILSLVQFDNEIETVFSGTPIKDVKPYELKPRGMTALLDAVGKTINDMLDRLKEMKTKPKLVVVAIITDGQENNSSKFNRADIKKLIEDQTKEGWQFTFLGANQDAFSEAGSMGIARGATAQYSTVNTQAMYVSLSNNVDRMRDLAYKGATVTCSYSDSEREKMK